MRLPCGLLLSALLFAPRLPAVEGLELHLDTLAGAGWQARNITLRLDMQDAASARLHIAIGQLDLPEPLGKVNDLQLDCAPLQLSDDELNCAQAQLRAYISLAGS